MATHDDQQLAANVLAELRRNTFLEPLAMQVIADNGVITLAGSIDSELNRQTAENMARLVPGVRDVVNQLTLIGQESYARDDADIQREVIEQMKADPTIQVERFHVRVQFGRVIIAGTAESLEERESVIAAAQRVPGVEGIDDRMQVRVPVVGES